MGPSAKDFSSRDVKNWEKLEKRQNRESLATEFISLTSLSVTYPSLNIVLLCLGVQTGPMEIIIPVAMASVLLALTVFSWNQID